MAVSLQQLVPLFSLSNLDEIGNPRSVLESAHQDDSKTPPGSQNWPRFDGVIEATKLCSLIFSSTRSIQDFFGNQLLHQILVNFGFQGVFWNRLDEQILKLTLDFQWDQDLAEKTCCCKLTAPYCIWYKNMDKCCRSSSTRSSLDFVKTIPNMT